MDVKNNRYPVHKTFQPIMVPGLAKFQQDEENAVQSYIVQKEENTFGRTALKQDNGNSMLALVLLQIAPE